MNNSLADKTGFKERFSRYCVNHRVALCAVATVLSLLLATGIPRNSFDTSLDALLTQSDPYVAELDLLQSEFPNPLEVTFAFIPPANTDVFNPVVLAAIQDLENSYTAIPHSQRLTTLVNYFSPERQQRLFTNPLDTYSDSDLSALRDRAITDRLLTNSMMAPDASLTLANVIIDDTSLTSNQRLDIAQASLQLRDELRLRNPDVEIHTNSEVILEQSSQQAMVDDLTQLLPIVILICVLAICYCFRSATLGICILGHTLFTLVCTIGVLGFLGMAFNSISVIAPLVVVIVSIANSVHLISIFKQDLLRGSDKRDAMHYSISYNLQPVTLAALTTAIGFSSLNLCSSPAIQDFGTIVAVGIVCSFVLTLTLLPALLVFATRNPAPNAESGTLFLQTPLTSLVAFSATYDKQLFYGFSILAVATLLLLPLNETDFNRLDFIAADTDIKLYYDVTGARMNRGPALVYAIDTHTIDGAIEPDFLNRVDEFQSWMIARNNIESVASTTDLVKTINRSQHQDDPQYYVIPDDINTVATYLNAYETVESEDYPLLSFINNDFSMITLVANASPMSNQAIIDLDQTVTDEFARRFGTGSEQATLVHGSAILLFSRMDERVTVELLQGYSLSLLLITLCLIVGMRSVHFGILSVLPNLLPATMVFGVWALVVGQLDPFVMMLFSISIGLVVDDTVHILSHYLEARQAGKDRNSSIAHSITTAGPALTITTLILALGTTILIAANTIYFQQAAKLLVPIVILALVLDLLFLPSILRRFDTRSDHP